MRNVNNIHTVCKKCIRLFIYKLKFQPIVFFISRFLGIVIITYRTQILKMILNFCKCNILIISMTVFHFIKDSAGNYHISTLFASDST